MMKRVSLTWMMGGLFLDFALVPTCAARGFNPAGTGTVQG
jgi:hypothetical protein